MVQSAEDRWERESSCVFFCEYWRHELPLNLSNLNPPPTGPSRMACTHTIELRRLNSVTFGLDLQIVSLSVYTVHFFHVYGWQWGEQFILFVRCGKTHIEALIEGVNDGDALTESHKNCSFCLFLCLFVGLFVLLWVLYWWFTMELLCTKLVQRRLHFSQLP